jgi:hypothetical protein
MLRAGVRSAARILSANTLPCLKKYIDHTDRAIFLLLPGPSLA